jgi:AcrR family transcriptional regulator
VTTTSTGKGGNGARLGRPRDGSIRRKVITAAIECYAERGWNGFNFETVSVRASVGRPALYRRWASREQLLIDAFRESTHRLPAPDSGNVRNDLTEIALAHRKLLAGARGRAGLRLFIEQETVAEVFRTVSAEITSQRDALILQALRRGQSRGEIRSDADLGVAHELLVGAVMLDSFSYDKKSAQIRRSVATMIDTLLRGLGSQPSTGGPAA